MFLRRQVRDRASCACHFSFSRIYDANTLYQLFSIYLPLLPLRQPLFIRARRLPRAPIGQLMARRGAHALNPRRPLHAEINRAANHASRPRNMRRRPSAHTRVLSPVLRGVLPPLTIKRMRRVRLILEPALSIRVIPAGVETPANGQRAEDPRITLLLVLWVGGVRTAAVAAVLSRGCAMIDAKYHSIAAGVRMRLLATLRVGGDARTIGQAILPILGPVAFAVAAAKRCRLPPHGRGCFVDPSLSSTPGGAGASGCSSANVGVSGSGSGRSA